MLASMMGSEKLHGKLLYRKFLKIVGPALVVMILVAGCGISSEESDTGEQEQKPESSTSGKRITVGETEAIVWGEGDRGVVLAHGASYNAASWEPQGQTLGDNDAVAVAVGGNLSFKMPPPSDHPK